MAITITCASCSQMCQVEDQHAGMMVRCPKCSSVIQVPRLPEPIGAAPPPAPVPTYVPPPPPPLVPAPADAPTAVASTPLEGVSPGPRPPGFLDTIQQAAATLGIDSLSLKLLYAGLGCLAFLVLVTFLPWGGGTLGIGTPYGILNFLLSMGAASFLIVAVIVIKKRQIFDVSLGVATEWCCIASLWRLADAAALGSYAGIGLYLALLGSLGAAGTLGFVLCRRFLGKKA